VPATYFPEGNTAKSSDDELRLLGKQAWALYDVNAPGDLSPFPEGNRPLPGDSEDRLRLKIINLL
jgi:hypothetical protein